MEKKENNLVKKDYKPIFVYDEMSSSYLSYAMSVIISRALPDDQNVASNDLDDEIPF